VVDASLDDFLRNDQTVLLEYFVQPRRDTACTEVASPALKAIGAEVRHTALLDNDHVEGSIKSLGLLKEMDGEERTGRPTADDGNAIVVAEANWLRKGGWHGPSLFGKDAGSVRAANDDPLQHRGCVLVEKDFRLAAKANQDAKETLCRFGMQKSLTRHI
jgi:hypothetical protein